MFTRLSQTKLVGDLRPIMLLLLALLVVPTATALGSHGYALTLTTHTVFTDVSANEISLARITTEPNGQGDVALELLWKKDTSGWFPIWKLYASSNIGLLSPATTENSSPGSTENTPLSAPTLVELTGNGPVAGHTYETTISYAADIGALAIKIYDLTDDRIMHVSGFDIPPHGGSLYATAGTVAPYYLPVSTTWTTGVGSGEATFLGINTYDTRREDAALRLATPAAVPGQYNIYLEYDDTVRPLHSVAPKTQETRIPLPLDEFPLGPSFIRVDYAENGTVLQSERRQIVVGRLDARMDRIAPDHQTGTVHTALNVRTAEPLGEQINLDVSATLYELIWNSEQNDFDYILYDEISLYQGTADMSTGNTDIPLVIPMPDVPGSWQVEIAATVVPPLATQIGGNERYFSTYSPAHVEPGDPYTIIVFPDTQLFAQDYPWIYTRMTDWVAANAHKLNIAAVWHVGDITNKDTHPQWVNAYASQSLLHGVVPYALTLGNHDMTNGAGGQVSQRGLTLINDYFTAEEARRYSNLAGTMVPDRLENHYYLFSIAGTDYLVIALEFGPPDEALAWANDIARRYPNHRLVLLTHSYTAKTGKQSRGPSGYPIAENPDTTVNSAPEMWNKFVRRHDNSFMVISGHTSPPLTLAHNVNRINANHVVYELLFDYQNQPNGGNGWLGVLTFLPNDTVEIGIYSPYLNAWADEIDSHGFTSRNIIDLKSKRVVRIPPQ